MIPEKDVVSIVYRKKIPFICALSYLCRKFLPENPMSETSVKYVNDYLEMNWKELSDLFSKYPYSQKITGFMSVKALEEQFFDLDNPGKKTFLQANNPGIQYANVIRDLDNLKEKLKKVDQISGSQDTVQGTIEQPVDHESEMLSNPKLTVNQQEISSGKAVAKGTNTSRAYQSDFTRWLLKQNIQFVPKAVEKEDKTLEKEVKPNDPNQLREEIVSEPLAALYAQQGLIKEAIEMYTKLSLKIPDKSAYFAEIIKKLKKSN